MLAFFSSLNLVCSQLILVPLQIYLYSLPTRLVTVSCSVVPNSLRPHELQPTRLFCPWDFPGKDIGVGCHFLLQGIFPTQGLNLGLLHVRQILYWLNYKGSHKEGWALKNWCFWTMVLEKTLGSPLDCKEIKPVNPKGNQSWIFTGGTDAETEAPILWPPDAKSWLIKKTLMLGKIEGGRRRGWQRMRWLDGIINAMDMSWWWTVKLWHAAVHGVTKSQTQLSD